MDAPCSQCHWRSYAVRSFGASSAVAQTIESTYKPPRTADGKPSFEGAWTNASITSLQRPARFKNLVIPGSARSKPITNDTSAGRAPTQRRQPELKDTKFDGKDLQGGRGYNAFWIDPGMTFARINGTYRTSFIVGPGRRTDPVQGSPAALRGRRRGRRSERSAPHAAWQFRRSRGTPAGRTLLLHERQRGTADADVPLQQQLRDRADGGSRGDSRRR